MRHWPIFLTTTLLLMSSSTWATPVTKDILADQQVDSLHSMFTEGDYALNVKAHLEDVRQTSIAHGHANTLALLLRYNTPYYEHLAGLMEFQHVSAYANRAFNPGQGIRPSKANRPVITDPESTALTQAYVQYNAFTDTVVRLGRQRIDLDDERWISSESFRQTPQTFDAFTIENHSHPNIQLFYGYIGQVNSIYQGSEASGALRKNHDHLFNVTWKEAPLGELIGYAYLIEDKQTITNSTRTYGLRWQGHFDVYNTGIHYTAEGARQYDSHNNPISYHANYRMAGLGADFTYITLRGQYQSLGGDKNSTGKALRAPLGSTHDLLGWAEAFNPIPDSGVQDFKISALSYIYDMGLEGAYHHFRKHGSSQRLGHEIDFGINKSFLESYALGLGYARFMTQTNTIPDTQRWYAVFSIHFR